MNMLAPITLAPRPDREPRAHRLSADDRRLLEMAPFPASAQALQAAPSDAIGAEAATFALLDREERILVLLVRSRSRLAALAGSWTAAIERRLPAPSPESAAARARKSRLAALGRYAILYRLDRGGLAFEEEDRLARAGFSTAQAEAIRILVDRFDQGWSPAGRRWGKSAIFLALAAVGTFLIQRWLVTAVDDRLMAWLLAIVVATGVAGFLAVTAHPSGSYRA